MIARAQQGFDWLFRDRVTGRVVIAQRPNLPFGLFLGATLVRLVARPSGDVGTAVRGLATVALVWWAVDEVVRGVNPFRRGMGALVLVGIGAAAATR